MYFLSASVWHLYGMYFLLGLVGTTVSVIPHARLSISWFDRRKGLALALSSTGVGIAGIIIPPYIRGVIEWAGWREAYLFLGGINLLVSLPLVYWVVCDRPEQKGTYPDGIPPATAGGEARTAVTGYPFGECLRSARLWMFGVIFAIFAATHVGPVSQWVPLLMDSGFTAATAAYAASLLGASLVVGRLGCGYLVDRFFAPHVAIGFQIIRIAGFTALVLEPGSWTGILATISLGLVMGAEFNLMPFFCVQYFGRHAFGKVYAVILVWFALGAAPATFLTGLSHDVFSTYAVALMIAVALNIVGIGLLLTVGPYPKLPEQVAPEKPPA
jgi:predicted MFS family arabinose efflux permease